MCQHLFYDGSMKRRCSLFPNVSSQKLFFLTTQPTSLENSRRLSIVQQFSAGIRYHFNPVNLLTLQESGSEWFVPGTIPLHANIDSTALTADTFTTLHCTVNQFMIRLPITAVSADYRATKRLLPTTFCSEGQIAAYPLHWYVLSRYDYRSNPNEKSQFYSFIIVKSEN